MTAPQQPSTAAPTRPSAQRRKPSPLGNQALLGRLQAKLTVGAVDDPLEHEADAVAEQVMRAPDSDLGVSSTPPNISRKCASCDAEETIQAKCDACEGETKLRTKRADDHDSNEEAPVAVDRALRQPGRALDKATRDFFEPRFGADFSDVRVHTGVEADKSAKSVSAVAYAVGQDMVFANGRFAPESHGGRKLLAHELAHVVQQGGGAKPAVRREGDPAAQDGSQAQTSPQSQPMAMGAPADFDFQSADGPESDDASADGAPVQRQVDATLRRQTGPQGAAAGTPATAPTLSWNDFPPSQTKRGGFSALTSFNTNWRSDGTQFRATFNKQKSWSYVADQTPYLLRHEQYHLNLAVLIANKANASAAAGTLKGKALIKAFKTAMTMYQKNYDDDTNHSLNTSMQAAWEKDIDTEAPAFPVDAEASKSPKGDYPVSTLPPGQSYA